MSEPNLRKWRVFLIMEGSVVVEATDRPNAVARALQIAGQNPELVCWDTPDVNGTREKK